MNSLKSGGDQDPNTIWILVVTKINVPPTSLRVCVSVYLLKQFSVVISTFKSSEKMESILKQETVGELSSAEGQRRRNSSVVFSDEVEVIGEEHFHLPSNRPTRLPVVITRNVSPARRKQDYSTRRRRSRGATEKIKNWDTKHDQWQHERRGGGAADRRTMRLDKAKQDERRNKEAVPYIAMPDIRITDADKDLNEQYGSGYDEMLHGRWMDEAEHQRTLYEVEFQKQQDESHPDDQLEPEVDEEAKDYNDSRLLKNEDAMNLNEGYQDTLPELQPRKLAWSEEENDAENDFKEKEGNTFDQQVKSKKSGRRKRKKKTKQGSRSRQSSRNKTDNEHQVSLSLSFLSTY